MSKVHFNLGRGRIACGYRRWHCQVLTSTKNLASVTCIRCSRTTQA